MVGRVANARVCKTRVRKDFGGSSPSPPTKITKFDSNPMLSKKKLERLYKSGLSMMEISDRTGWKYEKIIYWMRKYNVPRRSRSEATYVKRNPQGDPFKIKNKLNKAGVSLKQLGLGLYWGEGDKSSNNTQVRISNTDPRLIKKFKEFLVKICGVEKEKFKYSLVIFNDGNKTEAVKFWKSHLGIKRSQFGKIITIPAQGKGTYKKKNQFGVLTISVSNKKFLK